jgi:uncharacterized protein
MLHQYKLNGFNIVLDANSGSIHSVDEVAYDVIAMLDAGMERDAVVQKALESYGDRPDVNRAELEELLADIEALKAEGRLFSPDIFEDKASVFKNRDGCVKALCLHVAHACNLNCSYCFAGQGRYSGERALMPFEVGKRAIDFLVENSGTRRNLEVDFFGGEPLMNFETVKRITAYARSIEKEKNKNFRFTLTTNGVLLDDEATEFANRECHNVVLSLDGRRETHDRLRKTPGGGGSYDLVVPKFRRFVRARGERSYYVRGTYTRYNTDFTNDIFHMLDLGFTELSMEPVVCAPDEPYALTEQDLPVLFKQYELLACDMLRRSREGRGYTFYHYMLDLENGPCIHKRISGCGSGTEYLAVTPEGKLYPCHQFVGDAKYLMGDVWSGVTNAAVREEFGACSAYSRPECASCWARLYCSGGCAANAYHASGSVSGVYEYGCRLFKKRLECAIMLKAAQAEAAPGACGACAEAGRRDE